VDTNDFLHTCACLQQSGMHVRYLLQVYAWVRRFLLGCEQAQYVQYAQLELHMSIAAPILLGTCASTCLLSFKFARASPHVSTYPPLHPTVSNLIPAAKDRRKIFSASVVNHILPKLRVLKVDILEAKEPYKLI
jgi:hypothetical protein